MSARTTWTHAASSGTSSMPAANASSPTRSPVSASRHQRWVSQSRTAFVLPARSPIAAASALAASTSENRPSSSARIAFHNGPYHSYSGCRALRGLEPERERLVVGRVEVAELEVRDEGRNRRANSSSDQSPSVVACCNISSPYRSRSDAWSGPACTSQSAASACTIARSSAAARGEGDRLPRQRAALPLGSIIVSAIDRRAATSARSTASSSGSAVCASHRRSICSRSNMSTSKPADPELRLSAARARNVGRATSRRERRDTCELLGASVPRSPPPRCASPDANSSSHRCPSSPPARSRHRIAWSYQRAASAYVGDPAGVVTGSPREIRGPGRIPRAREH